MALGTIFSTFSGRPSWRVLGTLESPVACETLPVLGLLPVSWTASGSLSSTDLGALGLVLVWRDLGGKLLLFLWEVTNLVLDSAGDRRLGGVGGALALLVGESGRHVCEVVWLWFWL